MLALEARLAARAPGNIGPPPSMQHPVCPSADPLEQTPGGQTHIHEIMRLDTPEVLRCAEWGLHPPCMGCRSQAHPQATGPHPVLVPRVHVADDLHQVLGMNAADPLLGQGGETAQGA